MDDAAYHGLAGDVVKTIRPHTESDPVAILIPFLTCFGNVIGHTAYYQVESDRHHANLFAALVGQSSKARKGTAMGRVSAVAKIADNRWFDDRMKGGLSSGEGLITEVRDEIKKWDAKSKTFETVDPGVTDKRLMVSEAEFASALAVMERHGNTLSPVIRKAWDGGNSRPSPEARPCVPPGVTSRSSVTLPKMNCAPVSPEPIWRMGLQSVSVRTHQALEGAAVRRQPERWRDPASR